MEKHTERICRESKCLVFPAFSLLPLSCKDLPICVDPRLGLEVPLLSTLVRVPWPREMKQAPASLRACHGSLGGSQLALFFLNGVIQTRLRMVAKKQSLAFPSISPTSPHALFPQHPWSSLLLVEHQDHPHLMLLFWLDPVLYGSADTLPFESSFPWIPG